ncbi:hypothetical protein TWF569_000803 [Orbilia oligospora]|uniref:Chromatin modification-related protein n=2 Tax=Orbilia oligospora TaxID=2813651 RepID=A0A7C8IZ82_ORBOL|nr:hypothetical protein TWF102_003624 [Orbilia oligospora]KAF3083218.1 hypothetical protein TWF103_003001 [Orbilia oligospora]KAF3096844.1 hypothetical protein TWF706_007547 [Orbilia oligospora]KAF3125525.1 hypothetical protein TWF569_000803 [Orbilia oligospora]
MVTLTTARQHTSPSTALFATSRYLLTYLPTNHQPIVISTAMAGTNPRRPPQFYPGLAAFTDAIEALPQETIRHFTLLREVDAKASGPEDLLRNFIKNALSIPPPLQAPPKAEPITEPARVLDDQSDKPLSNNNNNNNNNNTSSTSSNLSDNNQSNEHVKRSRLHEVRVLISDLLLTLDEKIHVISTASEALAKHQVRIDDAYGATTREIDSVLRDGNPAHWAYGNSILESSFNLGAGANENMSTGYPVDPDSSIGTSRADGRREGASRRYAHAPEQLEPKTINQTEPTTLNYENSPTIPAAKRRKGVTHGNQLNKTLAPERSAAQARSGAYSNSHILQNTKTQPIAKVHGSQSSTSNQKQPASRKRMPAPPVATLLSPTKHNFTDSRAMGAPPQSSENFIIAELDGGKKDMGHRNPRSKSHLTKPDAPRAVPKIDNHVKQEEKILSFESKPATIPKPPQDKSLQSENEAMVSSDKETSNQKLDSTAPQGTPADTTKDIAKNDQNVTLGDEGPAAVEKFPRDINVAEKSSQVGPPKALPHRLFKSSNEPSVQMDDKSILNNARGDNGNNAGGNGNNDDNDDDDNNDDDDDEGEGDDDEGDVDADEMRYCYCNQISYGKMVACDGPGCQREWFHLPCVGLSHMPSSKDKWYCRECRTAIQNTPKASKASQHRV